MLKETIYKSHSSHTLTQLLAKPVGKQQYHLLMFIAICLLLCAICLKPVLVRLNSQHCSNTYLYTSVGYILQTIALLF